MKKLVYTAMLLLGLSMMISCDGGNNYSNSSNGKANSNTLEKEFSKAFENKECIYFRTNYVYHHSMDMPLFYLVLYPFVFSDNGLRGIMYIVTYGTRKYEGGEASSLFYWGEYEVVGNYLRLNNIVDVIHGKQYLPRIYKISQMGGNLQLEGKFIGEHDISINVQEQQPIPNVISSLINNDRYKYCMHK